MHDPVAVGRRTAHRALAIAAIAAALVALAFFVQGPKHAMAAAAGGGIMVLAYALAAFVALGGGIQPAGAAFARMVFGTLAKWAVVMAGLVVAFGVWRLPPLPTLVGLVAAVLAYLLALNFGRAKA